MGFFKDINTDSDNSADDLVNVTADEEVDASLLESLYDGSNDSDDIAVVDEKYDFEGVTGEIKPETEEAPAPEEEKIATDDDNVLPSIGEPEIMVEPEEPADTLVAATEEAAAAPVPTFKRLDESAAKAPARSTSNDDQVTVITKGTTINGSIISDCSLNVMGTINGDIECVGKLTISGNVAGNSTASDVFVSAKRLNGNIDSEGTVKVGLGTVVVGDIKAGSAVVAGAVKGELDIQGPIVIDSTAIIKGNVKAKSVQMNNGAILEGFCSLIYSSVSVDDIFE
ncbi:MAG: polymer-forming cytoskeletal protein [Lachnospiraceae bacterium]|nr:polymer-forming cytoskeletal protein [Lachnospiraceae bacterium]